MGTSSTLFTTNTNSCQMLHLTNISGENRITLENAFNCGLFCLSSDTHSELPAWPQLTYRL